MINPIFTEDCWVFAIALIQLIIFKTSKGVPTNPKKMTSFCAWDDDTLILNVLGTSSAKRDVIGKVKGNQLKISVTEAPRAGRATDHMVRFLAEEVTLSH